MVICSIDPGGTTGFCVVDTTNRTVLTQQLGTHQEVVLALAEVIYDYYWSDLVVVIEDFIGAGRRDTNVITTLKLLGFVIHYCTLMGVRLVVQPPQYRKPFLDVAELRYPKYERRHGKDAYAHALAYLVLSSNGVLTPQFVNLSLTEGEIDGSRDNRS